METFKIGFLDLLFWINKSHKDLLHVSWFSHGLKKTQQKWGKGKKPSFCCFESPWILEWSLETVRKIFLFLLEQFLISWLLMEGFVFHKENIFRPEFFTFGDTFTRDFVIFRKTLQFMVDVSIHFTRVTVVSPNIQQVGYH